MGKEGAAGREWRDVWERGRGVSKIIDQRLSPSTPPNPIALIQALLNSRAITSTQP